MLNYRTRPITPGTVETRSSSGILMTDPRGVNLRPTLPRQSEVARFRYGSMELGSLTQLNLDAEKVKHLATEHLFPQNAQRRRDAPTVNPAPTEASSTRSPFLSRCSVMASCMASGIVAAVVFPYF
jgi:hypothetical protein